MTRGTQDQARAQARLAYSAPLSSVIGLYKEGKTPYAVKLDVLASVLPQCATQLASPAVAILLDFFELNGIDSTLDVLPSDTMSGLQTATQEERAQGFTVKLSYTCVAWIDQDRPLRVR